MKKSVLLLLIAPLLGGCLGDEGPASVMGGECKLVQAPKYAILGKTSYDQVWANETIESIVVGCKQRRPLARPASMDAAPSKAIPPSSPRVSSIPRATPAVFRTSTPTSEPGVVEPPRKKVRWRDRFKRWFKGK